MELNMASEVAMMAAEVSKLLTTQIELITFTDTANTAGEVTASTPVVLRTVRGRIDGPKDKVPRPYEGDRPVEEMTWTLHMEKDVDLSGAQAFAAVGTVYAMTHGGLGVLLYQVADNIQGTWRTETVLTCSSSNTTRPDFL